jgi:hypothetical protein
MTACPSLQELFNTVIKYHDNTIVCGHRGEDAQNAAYEAGRSKVKYPFGKHNRKPSEAIDSAPYLPRRKIPWPKTPSNWNHRNQRNAYIKDVNQFYYYAGYVMAIAAMKGISVRWGGDWDRDHDLSDQSFDDLVHFEIKE